MEGWFGAKGEMMEGKAIPASIDDSIPLKEGCALSRDMLDTVLLYCSGVAH